MANTYTVHIHETYGSLVENDSVEVARLDHSPGLSFAVFSDLVHRAYHLVNFDAGDKIEIHLETGVVFNCTGTSCRYAQG
jgi:hypothetical protein